MPKKKMEKKPENLGDSLENKFGEGMEKASSKVQHYENIDWIDTGSLTLNRQINPGHRGFPTGCMVEISGDSMSGKSLFGLHCIKSTIDQGGIAVYIDAEGSFEPKLAKDIGINLDELYIIDPMSVHGKEENLTPLTVNEVMTKIEFILKKVRSQYGKGHLLVIVWDSLAGTNFLEDLSEEVPKETQGRPEKRIKHWIRRIRPLVSSSNSLFLVINQVYSVIGSFVPTDATPGGKSVGFHSHIRIKCFYKDTKQGKVFDNDGFAIGARLHFEVSKNRVGPPWGTGFTEFLFDKNGVPSMDFYSGYLNFLVDKKAIETGKGKVIVGEDSYRVKKAQGKFYRSNFVEKMLENHPELLGV